MVLEEKFKNNEFEHKSDMKIPENSNSKDSTNSLLNEIKTNIDKSSTEKIKQQELHETKSDSSIFSSEKNILKTDEKKQTFNHINSNLIENTNKDNLSLNASDPNGLKTKKKKGVKLRYLIDESTTIDMLHHKSNAVLYFLIEFFFKFIFLKL
jgi:hypothetical protein